MIELVDRFEADDERRIAVLLEHRGRKQRRLEAVRGAMPDDAAKAAQRGAARRRLGVVGKRVQVALNRERRAQPRDQPSLGAVNRLTLRSLRGRRSQLGDELRGRPVGSGVALGDPAVAVDDASCAACGRSRPDSPPRRARASRSRLVAKRSISSRSPVTNVQTLRIGAELLRVLSSAPAACRSSDRS